MAFNLKLPDFLSAKRKPAGQATSATTVMDDAPAMLAEAPGPSGFLNQYSITRQLLILGGIVLFLMALAMASPPEMPSAFYGVVTTASGTPNGQAFTASINGSSTSTVIGPTSTYSCGASICNYYMTISRKAGDAASSEIVFSINGNALQQKGTFSQGAIVRLDFPDVPQSYLACLSNCQSGDSGLGSSSSTGSSGGGGAFVFPAPLFAPQRAGSGQGVAARTGARLRLRA